MNEGEINNTSQVTLTSYHSPKFGLKRNKVVPYEADSSVMIETAPQVEEVSQAKVRISRTRPIII